MEKVFAEEIIKYASENSAGTILDESNICKVIKNVIETRNLNKNYIDKLLDEFQCDCGYLVKSSDVIYTLKPYIINDEIDYGNEEKPEKDYEMIEILYGDFHYECGDRD